MTRRKRKEPSEREWKKTIDRVETRLLLAVANRALGEHAVMDAAQRALDMVDARRWRHDWRRKRRIDDDTVEALKIIQ